MPGFPEQSTDERQTSGVSLRPSGSRARVLALARQASPDELLKPRTFGWTGMNAVVTYLGANAASHYLFACKVLKRWLRSDGRTDAQCGANSG